MTLRNYSRIIVRMPNWIGDLVMATPILADLKAFFPNASITVLCKEPLSDLLTHDPHIDEIISFSKLSLSKPNEKKALLQKIKNSHFDLGILLTNSLSTAWQLYLAKVKTRIGFKWNFLRGWLLSKSVTYPKNAADLHQVIIYKKILAPLGIQESPTPPKVYMTDEEMKEAFSFLKKKGIPAGAKIVGINPGAAYGSAKCWLPERFKEVAKRLSGIEDVFVVFFGDKSQAPLIKEICAGLSSKVINLAQTTSLRGLAASISCCSVLLTNDSGPMHIADALNVPIVALFGSTSVKMTGPYRGQQTIYKKVPCSPCFKRVCPIDFICMKKIETDEVFHALCKKLNKPYSKLPLFQS